jgi:transcriptional regulator GlxA family with amidase domain
MVDFIDDGYAGRLTLKSVAAAVRGNPAKLGRQFQTKIGISVHGYLTRVRLEHAAQLIASNVKIEAVALDVGYRSKKNFYRQFIRRFGVTPDIFRHRRRSTRR